MKLNHCFSYKATFEEKPEFYIIQKIYNSDIDLLQFKYLRFPFLKKLGQSVVRPFKNRNKWHAMKYLFASCKN